MPVSDLADFWIKKVFNGADHEIPFWSKNQPNPETDALKLTLFSAFSQLVITRVCITTFTKKKSGQLSEA